MSKLWKKSGMVAAHPLIEKYTVGDDYWLDIRLMRFDIQASKAHAEMLLKIGILTQEDLDKLLMGFDQLMEKLEQGEVEIRIADEDCHTYIENFLIATCGEVGKKIHTGRSRNDQVLVAMRLMMKDQLMSLKRDTFHLVKQILEFAKKYQDQPMPGYSHTQQAMLSSVGHWAGSFVEALINDYQFLAMVETLINQNPLGSAAGFGVGIPLDREMTAEQLGFAKVQQNSLYCQLSRGKFESLFLEACSQVMMTLGKLASDLILFTSQEFQFFQVSDQFTTGSSIMPQKRNLDPCEIMRAKVSEVISQQMMIKDIAKNLISGYHRDLQLIKRPLMLGFDSTNESLQIMLGVFRDLKPQPKMIEAKITKGMFMADLANEMVEKEGLPFRDAYKMAFEKIDDYSVDYAKNLASKVSLGAPGNLGLEIYEEWVSSVFDI